MGNFFKAVGKELYRSAVRTFFAVVVGVVGGAVGLIFFAFSWHVALIILGATLILMLVIVGPVAMRILRATRTGAELAVGFGSAIVHEVSSRRQQPQGDDDQAELDQTAELHRGEQY